MLGCAVLCCAVWCLALAAPGGPAINVWSCTPSTRGFVEVQYTPGISFEHMIGLANAVQADAWICVPHLATDDFITQLAYMLRGNLKVRQPQPQPYGWMRSGRDAVFRVLL
jgi:hypothetical protein